MGTPGHIELIVIAVIALIFIAQFVGLGIVIFFIVKFAVKAGNRESRDDE